MADDEMTPLDRIIMALSQGKEPDEKDKKSMTSEDLAKLKSEIEDAQAKGFSVEVPF